MAWSKEQMKMPSARTPIRYSGARRIPVLSQMVKRSVTEEIQKPKTQMGLINGRMPESSYEWNIALALWEYGWTFYYQLSVLGGSSVRGGQRLDFLVLTRPFYTALAVDAGYWHRNNQEESLKDAQLIQGLREMGYLVQNDVVHAIDENAATASDAASFIHKNFGRG